MLIVPCASIRDLFRVNRERGWDDGGIKVQLINSRSGKEFSFQKSPFHLPGEFLWNSSPAPLRITGLRGTYDAGHSYRDSGWQETRFLCCWVPPCRRCTKKKKKNKMFVEEGWEQWKFEAEFWGRIFIRNCSREKRDRISWVEEIFIKWIYPLILEKKKKEGSVKGK